MALKILGETSKFENIIFRFWNLGPWGINICMFPNQWHHKIQKKNLNRELWKSKSIVWTLLWFLHDLLSEVSKHPSIKWLSHVLCVCLRRIHHELFKFNIWYLFEEMMVPFLSSSRTVIPLASYTYQDKTSKIAKFVAKSGSKWVVNITPVTLRMFPRKK